MGDMSFDPSLSGPTYAVVERRTPMFDPALYNASGWAMPGMAMKIGATTTFAYTVSRIIFEAPFFLNRPTYFDKLAIMVSSAAAGSVCRMGVFKLGSDMVPASVAIDAGSTVDTSATGLKSVTLSTPALLQPGWYRCGVLSKTLAPTLRIIPAGYTGMMFYDNTTAWGSDNYYIDSSAIYDATSAFDLSALSVTKRQSSSADPFCGVLVQTRAA